MDSRKIFHVTTGLLLRYDDNGDTSYSADPSYIEPEIMAEAETAMQQHERDARWLREWLQQRRADTDQ